MIRDMLIRLSHAALRLVFLTSVLDALVTMTVEQTGVPMSSRVLLSFRFAAKCSYDFCAFGLGQPYLRRPLAV